MKSLNEKIERKTGFDVLRLVLMGMIIFHHFAYHGVVSASFVPESFDWWQNGHTLNRLWVSFILPGGNVGNGVFFALSGYLLYGKDNVKLEKFVSFFCQALFYTIIFFILYFVLRTRHFSFISINKNQIIGSVFNPIASWWFLTVYLMIYVCHPFLNKIGKVLTRKQFCFLLVLLSIVYLVEPNILYRTPYAGFEKGVFFYLFGEYCAIYTSKHQKYWYLLGIIVSWLIMTGTPFITHIQGYGIVYKCLMCAVSLIDNYMVIFCCLCLIRFFEHLEFKTSKFVPLSQYVFGVYLIHDHPLMRELLWGLIVRPYALYEVPVFFILYVLYHVKTLPK